jgi:hypothetical protein
MFEYMMQGIARAGGVEMQAGSTILPQKVVEPRQAGIVRLFTGRLMARAAGKLHNWSSKLLELVSHKNESSLRRHDAITDICSTRA